MPPKRGRAGTGSKAGGDEDVSKKKYAPRMSRELTFVKCTLSDVLGAAVREHPTLKFHEHFWHEVLTQEPAEEFHPLANRTFPFWVDAFNKWLALRRSGECSVRDMSINGVQLRAIFSLSLRSVNSIVELFDPEGFAQLSGRGAESDKHLKRCIISMPELATAGVLLSKLIPRRVKMNFLLGLFDLDDSGSLNEVQFTMFLRTFHGGLGAAFKVSSQLTAPVPELRRRAADLFARAMNLSTLPGVPDDDSRGLCYETLWEWWCGKFSDYDSLALPYTLVVQRFAPAMGIDVADCFDEDLHDFRLSHSAPMALKVEKTTCIVHGSNTSLCKFLTMPVVLGARALFEAAQELEDWRPFAEQEAALEEAVRSHPLLANQNMRQQLMRDLRNLCWFNGEEQGCITGLSFTAFLRRLCPCALTKHLRMFDNFCEQHDHQVQRNAQAQFYATAADVFAQNEAKPVLPKHEVCILRDEFAKLDLSSRGFVSADDITSAWGWTMDQALETIESFDSCLDGLIDEDEFLRMMCPAEYRLPQMAGTGRELVGQMLAFEWETLSKKLTDDEDAGIVPVAVLPDVPEAILAQWTEAWDTFNRRGGDLVTVPDLECSGLLSKQVCQSVVRLIDPHDETGFTREAFFFQLCRAYGYRPRFEDACAVTARAEA